MSISYEGLRELARHAAHGTAPDKFSNESINEALVQELNKMCGSINDFHRNKYDLFAIIIENAEEIVPVKVEAALGAFAEIKNVAQNEKAMFKTTLGKSRAKQFITQVGISGVYETFRLDSNTYTVQPRAIGGAVRLDFERVLDGADTLLDVMNIITEGLIEAVFNEVQKALVASFNAQRPSNNKYIDNAFDAKNMFKLASTVKAYGAGSTGIGRGAGATIFAPPQFIYSMGIDNLKDVNGGQGVNPSDDQVNEIVQTGYIRLFRGIPVIEIPQSFTDENNNVFTVRPDLAYVLPTGKEKVVKLALEGATQIYDYVNRDNSVEINAYKKIGVGIQTYHNWGIYQNLELTTEYKDSIKADLDLIK